MSLKRFIGNLRTDTDRADIPLDPDDVYRILSRERRRQLVVAFARAGDE
ncbi:hypothetical protein HUG10_19945 (plasmid) [Halorarum halophilum]|uniref:Uncharacterized protein n=1 Tax=Halorarum halophilum TaxID=2743090 RepID=A0A7D5GEK7_9EURY|nr:hypothetical protein [Halobaculum halophilum]QLG29885.1 hypothetical protein HUG10_19945 [Halobaculum halophilum]